MRWIFITLVLFVISCKSPSEEKKMQDILAGNWLIIAPDHHLKGGRQKLLYGKMQDSIVSLTGLKLITLSKNGIFRQTDSVEKQGRWGISPDDYVHIEKGGPGFENFSVKLTGYEDGLLKLTEFVPAEDEELELEWNLKKVDGKTASKLFDSEKNKWRIRPSQPETKQQIKERLAAMLQYYSEYFTLVTKESSFFIPARVILPVKYYQHAMGMRPFEENSFFTTLFYNSEQAQEAHKYLTLCFRVLKDDFPRLENYVKEYAAFMAKMAEYMREE